MVYDPQAIAVWLFVVIVGLVLLISWYFAAKAKSASGYFAAGGTIHWAVNGIAFAGDYLSAASFLGICGLIATAGYDGFLYSIGFLAGWIVALFVVAEPLKRLGKYTFADALDAKFNSKGIQLAAAISTLIVSMCYLIPQMVGAGVLVQPLLGLDHYMGVIIVGTIVVIIVATAGMTSTTYVQFLKGGLLIVFSVVLSIAVLQKGLTTNPEGYHEFMTLTPTIENGTVTGVADEGYTFVDTFEAAKLGGTNTFVKTEKDGVERYWHLTDVSGTNVLTEAVSIVKKADGNDLYNGHPKETRKTPLKDRHFFSVGHVKTITMAGKTVPSTGPVNAVNYFALLQDSEIVRFPKAVFDDGENKVSVWYQKTTSGRELLRPGQKFKIDDKKGATPMSKLDFISLLIALFFGTAALPHVLIRYYTVPSPKDARKSTIVAIAGIGFFYILTLFMGFGAMTNGVLDVTSNNMSAPLLARAVGTVLFSIISALAFATVLGTVSGLIVASSGAVAHDIVDRFAGVKLDEKAKVMAGKIAAVVVGIIAIILGILFKGMNVSFLVGLAFAVAASANLPAIVMLLFWKKTTAKGIVASIIVGIIASLVIILLSPSMFERYGMTRLDAPIPLDNPAIISLPLSFITLIIVSLLTQKKGEVQA